MAILSFDVFGLCALRILEPAKLQVTRRSVMHIFFFKRKGGILKWQTLWFKYCSEFQSRKMAGEFQTEHGDAVQTSAIIYTAPAWAVESWILMYSLRVWSTSMTCQIPHKLLEKKKTQKMQITSHFAWNCSTQPSSFFFRFFRFVFESWQPKRSNFVSLNI